MCQKRKPPEGGRKDGQALKRRIRHCIAKTMIILGITMSFGSVGACENEDCSLLQCMVCVTCGGALGLAGDEKGESVMREITVKYTLSGEPS